MQGYPELINQSNCAKSTTHAPPEYMLYRVYKKKLNRFEIALNFAKQLLVSSFFIYMACLGTYNVE